MNHSRRFPCLPFPIFLKPLARLTSRVGVKKLKFCSRCGFDASDHRDEDPEHAASCPRCSDHREMLPLTVVDVVESPSDVPFALAVVVFANVKRLGDSLSNALEETGEMLDDMRHGGSRSGVDELRELLERLVENVRACLSDLGEELDGWVWTLRRDFLSG